MHNAHSTMQYSRCAPFFFVFHLSLSFPSMCWCLCVCVCMPMHANMYCVFMWVWLLLLSFWQVVQHDACIRLHSLAMSRLMLGDGAEIMYTMNISISFSSPHSSPAGGATKIRSRWRWAYDMMVEKGRNNMFFCHECWQHNVCLLQRSSVICLNCISAPETRCVAFSFQLRPPKQTNRNERANEHYAGLHRHRRRTHRKSDKWKLGEVCVCGRFHHRNSVDFLVFQGALDAHDELPHTPTLLLSLSLSWIFRM